MPEVSQRDIAEMWYRRYQELWGDYERVLCEVRMLTELRRLAGLMDKTCENVSSEWRCFLCSECGYEAYTYDDSHCDPDEFKYCPNCGARVVRRGANDARS